jgi:hypothetical protein
MVLGSTQHVLGTSTRSLCVGKVRPARKADNLTAISLADCVENVAASTSHNPVGFVTCYRAAFVTPCLYTQAIANSQFYVRSQSCRATVSLLQSFRTGAT